MRWFFGWFKISLPGLLAGGLAFVSTSALALDIKAWEESINPETKERYIPVELWPGAEWDGKRELRMPKVDGTYSHRTATYQVKGPTEWKHPVTGKVFVVYERINPGKDGDESQIFTINDHQTGLGRLFDGRPGRDTRTYSGGLKFPLGLWKEDESKWFLYKVWDTRKHRGQKPSPLSRSILLFRTPRIAWNSTGRPRIERYPMIATRTSTAREKAW